MKKKLLIMFLALIIAFSAMYVGAELMNITTAGVDGDWVIYDGSKNIICTFDAANRKLTFPSGSALNVESGATAAIATATGTSLTLTGNVQGGVPITTLNAATAYNALGTALGGNTYRITQSQSIYLPQGTIGWNAIFRAIPGTVSLHPGTNDHFQYAASVTEAGSAIQLPGAAGNYVKIVYGAASVWEVQGNVGTITVP